MAVEAPIVDVLIHLDPALDYGPDWMPEPDPPVKIPILTARGSWSDVFNWIKDHAVLPSGVPITDPFGTIALTQQMINAAIGETVKALSGFMNRSAALTIQAASLLADSIDNAVAAEQYDFMVHDQQITQLQHVVNYLVGTVVPALEAQIAATDQHALTYALDAAAATRTWTEQTVLIPLIESLGQLKTDLLQVIDLKAQESHQISAQQVAALGAQLAPQIAAAAAAAAANKVFIDECGQPMCDAMGPKTDLGKLLKALKVAEWAALLAEIAALDKNGLEGALQQMQDVTLGIVNTFDNLFVGGGGTIGSTITAAGG